MDIASRKHISLVVEAQKQLLFQNSQFGCVSKLAMRRGCNSRQVRRTVITSCEFQLRKQAGRRRAQWESRQAAFKQVHMSTRAGQHSHRRDQRTQRGTSTWRSSANWMSGGCCPPRPARIITGPRQTQQLSVPLGYCTRCDVQPTSLSVLQSNAIHLLYEPSLKSAAAWRLKMVLCEAFAKPSLRNQPELAGAELKA